MDNPQVEEHDILIIGAGLSGINVAHLLRKRLPHRSFTLVEARHKIGGTWSFFRYPGFRSDSSMSTFGLQWHAWPHDSKVGSGERIMAYLESAVDAEPGLRGKIRLRHKVVGMEWSSERRRWRVDVDVNGGESRLVMDAKFIIGSTGYYDYEKAMDVDIPGLDDFQGQIVHPQFWPDEFDAKDKRIVLVGSGATTVTLLPQFVETAKEVTMIQRSPSYVSSIPTISNFEQFLKIFLPLSVVHWIAYWMDNFYELFMSSFVLTFPNVARSGLRKDTKAKLPKDVDVDIHFNPRYPPMIQRLCMTPDDEFFKCLHRENCHIVTDTIARVTKDSIEMTSGKKIPADVIITATGLRVHLLGGVIPRVDGRPVYPGKHFGWRGCMLEGLPNMAFIFGYVTTTWTPGSDQMSKVIIKLLKHMEKRSVEVATPRMGPDDLERENPKLAVKITSGYIVKAAERIPKVTGKGVCYGRENLVKDTLVLWFGNMDEGMEFSGHSEHGKDA